MNNKKDHIGFKLIKITTEQFAMIGEPPSNGVEIGISTNLKMGYSEKCNIGIFVQFTFEVADVPFIVIEIGCHFEIDSEGWDSLRDNEHQNIILPKQLGAHLAMIAVGTARGILHAKTENTKYNVFFIPLIDVSSWFLSDIILDKTDEMTSS